MRGFSGPGKLYDALRRKDKAMRFAFFILACVAFPSAFGQTICIDPGHSSENGSGTRGKKETELNVAWVVARKLEALLKENGYKVVMTKSAKNQKVTNKARAEVGNKADADYVVRLHCDAGHSSGLASYYPGERGKVGGVRGPSDEVIAQSKRLASKFHAAVIASLAGSLRDAGLHTDRKTLIGGRQGALTGSIYSKVPVVLVEMCVLQNPIDEAFIAPEKGKAKMARALFAGIQAAVPRRK